MDAYTVNGLDTPQVAQADEFRTKRLFVGLLSSALGVDQTYANEDYNASNAPDSYIIANPDGTFSVQGRARSNLNSRQVAAGLVIPPGLLLLGGLFLLVKLAK